MPQIRVYNQEIGVPGPVATQRATADDFGAGVGMGQETVGKSVGDLGEAIYKRQTQEDLSDLYANVAEARNQLGLKLQDQKQKGTLNHDQFMDDVSSTMESVGQNVNTREGQLRFKELQAQTKLTMSMDAQEGQAQLAGAKAVADFKRAADARSSEVMGNPRTFEQALKEQNQNINDLVATGGLPAIHADEFKREGADNLAKGAIRGMMNGPAITENGARISGPEQARKELDSGKWDPYLSENTKYKMDVEIDRAQRADEIRLNQLKKQAEQQAAEQEEKIAGGYLLKAHDPNGPGLDATQISRDLQDGKISSTVAEHFFKVAEQSAEDKKIKSDPVVFNNLTRRLALPEGTPGRITDIGEINSHLGKDLSIPDANLLYGLLGEKHTPQGEADAAIQKSYFDTVRAKLVKKNAMGLEDPEGMQLYQNVQAQSYQYELNAMKNGKSKNQIWSPTIGGKENPDYVGNHISSPTRSIQDIMKSQADLLKRSAVQGPPDTTLMEDSTGKEFYIPNGNIEKAMKERGFKKKGK